MKKNLLIGLLLLLPVSASSASTPPSPSTAAPAISLDALEHNCQAVKQIAAATIDLRYTGAKLYDVLKATDKTFKDKEDADYKRVFNHILRDAFSQSLYKEKLNIIAESKKFANKYYFLCTAMHRGF